MKKIGVIFNQSPGSFQMLNRDPKEWIGEIAANNSITGVEFDVRVMPAPQKVLQFINLVLQGE